MAEINLHWVQVPLHEPFRISNGQVSSKDAIVVEYEKDGITGWGEASPMAGSFYSSETPDSSWAALEKMSVAVVRDPAVDLDSVVSGEAFAKAGIAGALVDQELRAQKKLLVEWLGGSPKPVPSGVAIGLYDTIDELLERVDRFVREGYRRVKIKIKPGWDVVPVATIRKKYPQLPLMVDANAAYSMADIDVFKALDEFGLLMLEQPFARGDLDGLAELSRAVRTAVCADESAETMEMVEEMIAKKSVSIINIKIQRVGGIRNAKKMYDRVAAAGLGLWMGTMPELGIASMEAVHLGALPGFNYPTDVEASSRWYTDDIIDPPLAISSDGFLQPAGIEVNREKLERYRIRTACFV